MTLLKRSALYIRVIAICTFILLTLPSNTLTEQVIALLPNDYHNPILGHVFEILVLINGIVAINLATTMTLYSSALILSPVIRDRLKPIDEIAQSYLDLRTTYQMFLQLLIASLIAHATAWAFPTIIRYSLHYMPEFENQITSGVLILAYASIMAIISRLTIMRPILMISNIGDAIISTTKAR